jgi:hypothetical protein
VEDADYPLTITVQLPGQAQQTGDARYAEQVIGLFEGGMAAER